MPTQQIAQDTWTDFLSAFSAHNQTRSVNVDIESTDFGAQRLVDHEPLLAIEPSLEKELHRTITVIAGDPQGGNPTALSHEVANPKTIWVKEDDSGQAQALDIETDDGRTIIQFV